MAEYEVRIYDAFMNLLLILNEWILLEYGRVINDIGTLQLTLDFSYFIYLAGQKDAVIEVWRKVDDSTNWYLDGETQYNLRRIDLKLNTDNSETIIIYGYDNISLIARRSVIFKAGSSQAQKTAALDNMSKAIIRENHVSPTDPLRVISGMTCQLDLTLAPSQTKAFSNRNCLDVIKDLADASFTNGVYMAFDVVPIPATLSCEFRTYIGQRGLNRSALNPSTANTGIILDAEYDSLSEITKSFDWTDEATYIQANGPGQDADRLSAPALDATRLYGTSRGRVELVIDARNALDQAGTQAEADRALRQYRKRINYLGTATDTEQIKLGRDYKFGDLVTGQFFNDAVDVRVEAYKIKVDSSGEVVTVKLQAAV